MAPHEIDPQFGSYVHIRDLPRQGDALLMLKKLASVVKPMMRKRDWKVGELAEFLPPQLNLLGLNVNAGQKIFLRLRHGQDPKQFLAYDTVVDTLLHELAHIRHGPHDASFHKLWDELREEYYSLKRQGYTGEGFLGAGHRVGGRAIPLPEVRRQARLAAEKRMNLSAGSGQRLGGSTVPRGSDMRSVIANAAERRNNITQGCGFGNLMVEQKAEEEARRLGFRTKAEMDDADKLAIAIAMMEGDRDAHRQEMQALGASEEGLSWSPERGLEMAAPQQFAGVPNSNATSATSLKPVPSPTHSAASRPSASATRSGHPGSQLVTDNRSIIRQTSIPEVIDLTEDKPEQDGADSDSTWTCEICTLINDVQHLCCNACGIERPESLSKIATRAQGSSAPPQPLGWNCRRCGSFMEAQWWTCSACGLMKASS